MQTKKVRLFLLVVALPILIVTVAPAVMASPVGAAIRNKLLCATETGNCVEGWNGTDITLYSGRGSSQTLNLDGAAGNIDSEGTIDVAGNATLGGTLSVAGNISSATGAVTTTDNVLITGTLTVGVDGTGADVTFYSDTSGDTFLWDTSEEALTITGTNAQDALNIDDGNVDIADDVDVDGTTNLDDVDIDLATSLNIDGHMVDIGTGSYATANGDNDLGVAGDFEVDGATDLDGALDVAGNISSATGAITATDNVVITGQADAVQLTVTGYTTQTTDIAQIDGGLTDIGGGTYSVANGDNDLGVAGDIEATGNMVFGSDNLYALGIASASQEIACATTSTFTGSTNITTTAVTTPIYVVATQVTAPITTAAHLYVNDPTGITVTLTSLNSTFGAGTTGIAAHYCVVGTQ